MFRKGISILLAIIMLMSVSSFIPFSVNAENKDISNNDIATVGADIYLAETALPSEDEFVSSIASLQKTFVDGEYWNKYSSSDYSCTGKTACNGISHSSAHYGMRCSEVGYCDYCTCDCGYFAGAWQCMGFAYKMADKSLGSYPGQDGWSKTYSLGDIYAGDVIRIKNDAHSIFIYKVDGDTIYYADCNWVGPCKVRWGATYTYSQLKSTFTYKWHLSGNDLTGISSPSFTPLNMGDHFYAAIIHLQSGKALTEDNENVNLQNRDGYKNQKWEFTRQSDNSYEIKNTATGELLEVEHAGTDTGTNVGTWWSNGNDCQRWFIVSENGGYAFIPKHAQNRALDLSHTGNIQIWSQNYESDQLYGFDNQPSFSPVDIGTDFYANIVNIATDTCVSVAGNNVQNNTMTGEDSQKWRFERQSDLSYKVTNVATGYCLDLSNYGLQDGTNIQVMPSADNYAQRWFIRSNGNSYSIVPKCSTNLTMDLVGGNSADGANIAAWTFVDNNVNQIFAISVQPSFEAYNMGDTFIAAMRFNATGSAVTAYSNYNVGVEKYKGNNNQLWKFERKKNRSYKITNLETGMCLDVSNYGTADGTNIQVMPSADNYAQRWFFKKTGNGFSLAPQCAVKSCIDSNDGGSRDGMNVYLWTQNATAAQVISLDYSLSPIATDRFLSNKYELYDVSMPWKEAKQFCEKQGGHLLTITSQEEQNYIAEFLKTNAKRYYAWLGATDSVSEGTWKWVNNEALSYNNWAANEPNDENSEDYLMVYANSGEWNDTHDIYLSTNNSFCFICEYDNAYPTEPTNPPTEPTNPPTEPPTNPPTEPTIIKLGDVDGDDEVTIIDATCIQRKLASIPTAKFVEAAADADEDGELTIIDTTIIQRWLAKLPSNENIGKPIA